jgi:hypothetical protein
MTDFRYSESDWRKVAAQLPKDANELDVRSSTELAAEHLIRDIGRPRPIPSKILKAVRQVSKSAKKLQTDIDALALATDELVSLVPMVTTIPRGALDETDIRVRDAIENVEATSRFLRFLPELARAADEHTIELQALARHPRKLSNSVDWWENEYITELLRIWRYHGGELKTSVDPVSDESRGPLIRFLSAATGPVFTACDRKALTGGQLRSRVRKARK